MLTAQQMADMRAAGQSWDAIGKIDGISGDTARHRYSRYKANPAASPDKTPDAPLHEISESDRLRQRNADLEAAIERLRKDKISEDAVMERVYHLASHNPAAPKWLGDRKITDAKKGERMRGVPICMWADWHYGEVVRPDEIGGLNEFDANICYDRVRELVECSVDIAMDHMGGHGAGEYPGAVVCLGGDFICGDIHEELAVTADRTPHECVNDLSDILYEALGDMADAFGRLYVPCVVGNHGRGTLKPRAKGRVHTSFEWNIYCNLQRAFKHDNRIQFHIPQQTDATFSVHGHSFLLTHGDALGVKGGDGIIGAIGPIMRGSLKVRGSEASIGRTVDTVLMGHYHQRFVSRGVVVTGTLKGYDEYARVFLRASYERPSQEMFFVHPTRGVSPNWPVYVDGVSESGLPWLREWKSDSTKVVAS